jgi:hypothetical protein
MGGADEAPGDWRALTLPIWAWHVLRPRRQLLARTDLSRLWSLLTGGLGL